MDRLSQLQKCLDQLVTQFFSSLNYINTNHDFEPLDGEAKLEDAQLHPAPKDQFQASLGELSHDIAEKAKQIEKLIDSLPGLETSENDQFESLGNLEKELQAVRAEEAEVVKERQNLLARCDKLVMQITEYKAEIEKGS